jgi:hypothetical protein
MQVTIGGNLPGTELPATPVQSQGQSQGQGQGQVHPVSAYKPGHLPPGIGQPLQHVSGTPGTLPGTPGSKMAGPGSKPAYAMPSPNPNLQRSSSGPSPNPNPNWVKQQQPNGKTPPPKS